MAASESGLNARLKLGVERLATTDDGDHFEIVVTGNDGAVPMLSMQDLTVVFHGNKFGIHTLLFQKLRQGRCRGAMFFFAIDHQGQGCSRQRVSHSNTNREV